MASELSLTMQNLTASIVKKKTECNTNEPGSTQKTSKKKDPEDTSEFYDDIYFDSDESETEGKHCIQTYKLIALMILCM